MITYCINCLVSSVFCNWEQFLNLSFLFGEIDTFGEPGQFLKIRCSSFWSRLSLAGVQQKRYLFQDITPGVHPSLIGDEFWSPG